MNKENDLRNSDERVNDDLEANEYEWRGVAYTGISSLAFLLLLIVAIFYLIL